MRTRTRDEVVEVTKHYTVLAQPSGRFWAIEVPEVGRATQARNISEIDVMARDLIKIMTETTEFTLNVQLKLPPEVEEHRKRAAELRADELRLRSEAAIELRTAARVLRNQGLALRDVGTLLGVSTARAGQLVGTGR